MMLLMVAIQKVKELLQIFSGVPSLTLRDHLSHDLAVHNRKMQMKVTLHEVIIIIIIILNVAKCNLG